MAWLLLAALMPLSVVKTLHHHESRTPVSHCSDEAPSQLPCDDDCVICQFSLLPFTPSETFRIRIYAKPIVYEPIAETEDICSEFFAPYGLRAPPC